MHKILFPFRTLFHLHKMYAFFVRLSHISSRQNQGAFSLTPNIFYDKIFELWKKQYATVAQPVEQLTRNEQVVRSNRISSSKNPWDKIISQGFFLYFLLFWLWLYGKNHLAASSLRSRYLS